MSEWNRAGEHAANMNLLWIAWIVGLAAARHLMPLKFPGKILCAAFIQTELCAFLGATAYVEPQITTVLLCKRTRRAQSMLIVPAAAVNLRKARPTVFLLAEEPAEVSLGGQMVDASSNE